mmetsp:Transcript_504/g.501  ORF Transcript_504/g.501 Transcript_504/m.501 type:complete len:101 (-) Transcript_504:18-320(-)
MQKNLTKPRPGLTSSSFCIRALKSSRSSRSLRKSLKSPLKILGSELKKNLPSKQKNPKRLISIRSPLGEASRTTSRHLHKERSPVKKQSSCVISAEVNKN